MTNGVRVRPLRCGITNRRSVRQNETATFLGSRFSGFGGCSGGDLFLSLQSCAQARLSRSLPIAGIGKVAGLEGARFHPDDEITWGGAWLQEFNREGLVSGLRPTLRRGAKDGAPGRWSNSPDRLIYFTRAVGLVDFFYFVFVGLAVLAGGEGWFFAEFGLDVAPDCVAGIVDGFEEAARRLGDGF
jgi:hypothetical protein